MAQAPQTPHRRLNSLPTQGRDRGVANGDKSLPNAPLVPSRPEHRQYRILSHQEESEFRAIRRQEEICLDLRVRVTEKCRSRFTLRPLHQKLAFLIARSARKDEELLSINFGEDEGEALGVVLR